MTANSNENILMYCNKENVVGQRGGGDFLAKN